MMGVNKKERILWIDQLRGIAMFFVVLGHVALPREMQSVIYSFHMPLFFIISGLTLNDEKIRRTSMKEYIWNKFQKLIIPYLWMCFAMFSLWYFAYHCLKDIETGIWGAFLGIFIGNNAFVSAPSNALWFLLVLFLADILYAVIVKYAGDNEKYVTLAIAVCLCIGYLDQGIKHIWHLNVAFTAVVFMYVGKCFMDYYKSHEHIRTVSLRDAGYCGCIALLFVIGVISHQLNGRISMTANKFGNSVIFYYITALSFSFALIFIIMKMPVIKILKYIGQNTLLYVDVHLPILRIFENAYPDIFLKYQYSIPFSVVLFLGMALLCILVNSFFPYVCGKKNEKYKEAVYIGKFVLLFECFIIPVFGLIRRCGLWKHDIIHMIFVALVTGICSVLFLVITQKHIPFIYMEKKENS